MTLYLLTSQARSSEQPSLELWQRGRQGLGSEGSRFQLSNLIVDGSPCHLLQNDLSCS